MATPKSQRIGIWIVAIVLTVGTLGSFLVMGLSVNNQKIDQAQYQKQYEEYLASMKESSKANASNSEAFGGYSSRQFAPSGVDKLIVEVIKEGEGEIVSSSDSINSSYFGWLSDGTIFDSSKKIGVDDSPVTFSLAGVISGWTEGLSGVKVGSVVRLTIPSEKAYGQQESGIIPANSPLEFIVEIHKIDNSTTQEV
ncbi:MAG: FKBP-type peptidyl-prolyl cis-trans isomerase [Candidatus Saccharibacteria bacterium]